jgi:hypothetical protein
VKDLDRDHSVYGLRLLEASHCFNATSIGLREMLRCLPHLVYLDLSHIRAAKDLEALRALGDLQHLQILKLRGVDLRDDGLAVICRFLKARLRSLDVRDNRLTDDGVRMILQECIITTSAAKQVVQGRLVHSQGLTVDMQNFFGFDLPSVYRTAEQDDYVKKTLTTRFNKYVDLDDASMTGITHLYISGNQVSVHAVAHLLSIKRLHVLDIGMPTTASSKIRSSKQPNNLFLHQTQDLVPLLERDGGELTYLRVNHSIVTSYIAPLSGPIVAELDSAPSPPILPVTPPIELEAAEMQFQELDSEPIFELEGSPVPETFSLSPESPNYNTESLSPKIDYSHEASAEPSERPLLSPLDTSYQIPPPLNLSTSPYVVSPLPSPNPVITVSDTDTPQGPVTQQAIPPLTNRARTYSGVLLDHESRVDYHKSQPHGLLPSMFRGLRTLVLTEIPSHSHSDELSQRIISFIRACGEEACWSRMQSRVSYALPPGQTGPHAELSHAKSLFALRQIVLEVKPYRRSDSLIAPEPWSRNVSKSSVEDKDCEEFWNAAANDFSFFDHGEDECGIPESEMTTAVPLEARQGKMVVGDDEFRARPFSPPKSPTTPLTSQATLIDTVSEISKFRKAMQALYTAALGQEAEPFVEGYWDGDIVVVRQ